MASGIHPRHPRCRGAQGNRNNRYSRYGERDTVVDEQANILSIGTDAVCLLASATRLSQRFAGIDFRERVNIERAVFALAKRICEDYLAFELQGFSLESKYELEPRLSASRVPLGVRNALDLAFEIRATLTALASGDPYVAGDIHSSVGGRANAVRLFAKRIRTYVGLAAEILPNEIRSSLQN